MLVHPRVLLRGPQTKQTSGPSNCVSLTCVLAVEVLNTIIMRSQNSVSTDTRLTTLTCFPALYNLATQVEKAVKRTSCALQATFKIWRCDRAVLQTEHVVAASCTGLQKCCSIKRHILDLIKTAVYSLKCITCENSESVCVCRAMLGLNGSRCYTDRGLKLLLSLSSCCWQGADSAVSLCLQESIFRHTLTASWLFCDVKNSSG